MDYIEERVASLEEKIDLLASVFGALSARVDALENAGKAVEEDE